MKQTLLENWKNEQASPGRKINDLLLEIYGFMPSNGSYPFTMIRLDESESGDLRTEPPLTSRVQLLVITRADYTKAEFADYVTKSREYTDMRSDLRPAFLENYLHKYENDEVRARWREQITSLAIGIVSQLARKQRIELIPVETDLAELDVRLHLRSKNLISYQLFDAR